MKKLLITICALSVLPLLAFATKPRPPITIKAMPKIGTGQAFKTVPVRPVGNCAGPCVEMASSELSLPAKRKLNGIFPQGDNAIVIGEVVGALPKMRVNLLNQGAEPQRVKAIQNAFVAAAVESPGWNDPTAQNNMLSLIQNIGKNGIAPYKEQVNEVEKNCNL